MKANFLAPVNQLGMGVVGTNLYTSLAKLADISLFPIGNIDVPDALASIIKMGIGRSQSFDPTAPSVRYWHPSDMALHVGRGKKVGYTIFESDRLSEAALHHLRSQDLVVVPTRWARKVLVQNHGFNRHDVEVVNHGVDTELFVPKALREDGPTVFYTTGKFEIRKGHVEVCQAFNQAFQPTDNVQLIVHCDNPFLDAVEDKEWKDFFMNSRMGQAGKIELVHGRFRTQDEVAQLISMVHCGVFPSRAEGWNLPLSECMAMGRAVIATDYSAHTEFCTPASARLISIDKLEPCFDGKWFMGDGEWAHFGSRQMEQLVWHLRQVHQERTEGQLKLNQAGINQISSFTWDAAAKRLLDIIE